MEHQANAQQRGKRRLIASVIHGIAKNGPVAGFGGRSGIIAIAAAMRDNGSVGRSR